MGRPDDVRNQPSGNAECLNHADPDSMQATRAFFPVVSSMM
jgi:hypothetical protein